MITKAVTYEGDGLTLTGRMAIPDGTGPFPGVLIGHEGPGLDPLQLARADELAELGYVGFALDYHGPHAPFADRSHMMARLDELTSDPDRTRTLATAALDALTAEPTVDASRVGAIGYCFGATLALELARSGADLKAIVGFHPGLTNVRPGDSANIRGSVLMIVGSEDPLVGLDERVTFEREMRAAGVDWQLHLLGGAEHSFTHPGVTDAAIPGLAYHPVAASVPSAPCSTCSARSSRTCRSGAGAGGNPAGEGFDPIRAPSAVTRHAAVTYSGKGGAAWARTSSRCWSPLGEVD